MTKRQAAINGAMTRMSGRNFEVWRATLSDLIDKAESGALKEPMPRHYAGTSGMLTVYPDGREEWSHQTK